MGWLLDRHAAVRKKEDFQPMNYSFFFSWALNFA
jgi:hypothetical protein